MELDGESHGTVEHDVVRLRRRDHLLFASVKYSDGVGRILEHEPEGPALHDEATPHTVGHLVGSTQTSRSGVPVEGRRRALQRESVR